MNGHAVSLAFLLEKVALRAEKYTIKLASGPCFQQLARTERLSCKLFQVCGFLSRKTCKAIEVVSCLISPELWLHTNIL